MKEFSWSLNFWGFLSMIQNKIGDQTGRRAVPILLQSNQSQGKQMYNHEHILTQNCVSSALKAKSLRAFPLPEGPPVLRGWGRAGPAAHPIARSPQSPAGPAVVCLDQIISPPNRRNFSSHPSHWWYRCRGHKSECAVSGEVPMPQGSQLLGENSSKHPFQISLF